MEIGSSGVSNYFAANVYASMNSSLNFNSVNSTSSPNTGMNIPESGNTVPRVGSPFLTDEASSRGLPNNPERMFLELATNISDRNTQALSNALSRSYEFTSSLRESAAAVEQSSQDITAISNNAVTESEDQGQVSARTAENATNAASRFAERYNSTINSFNLAPAYSRPVESIENAMQSAVNQNSDSLEQVGFSMNRNGTLSLDEGRFRTALQQNPSAIQNLFDQNSDFMSSLNSALDRAQDTRNVSNAEIATTINERSFGTYQSSVQASSMVSMTTIPAGIFLNRLA